MSDAVVDVIQPHFFNGKEVGLPITICEHTEATLIPASSFALPGRQRAHHPIFGGGKNELRIGPGAPPGQRGHYMIEFRFPHSKKRDFAGEFKNLFNKHTQVASGSGLPIYVTYGKHKPDQKKLLSKASIAELLDGGAASAALGVGEGAGMVATAAGASALGGPITIGVAVGIAVVIGSAAAVKQHHANKQAQQVFVRLSNDKISQAKLFDYETKHYHKTFYSQGCSFQSIAYDLDNFLR